MFEVIKSQLGSAKLDDGSTVHLRASIAGLHEAGMLPTGLTFGLTTQIVVTVNSPTELKEKVEGKPSPKDDKYISNLEIWEMRKIVEKTKAFEIIRYTGSDNRVYKITLEADATAASRTLEYRDQMGNPSYYVRWSDKVEVLVE